MADDAIDLIRTLGFEKVDLLGFSLGGFVVQDIALKAPELVRRLILTGTGAAGGTGIKNVGAVAWPLMIKGLLHLRAPKFYLFFTQTKNGRQAASDFLKRLKEQKKDRVKGPTPRAFLRNCKPSRLGATRHLRTSGACGSRHWSPTATATSWCPAKIRSRWRTELRTHN